MSHVGDTSNTAPTDGETPKSTSQSRATTGSSAVGESAKRLKFNENGLPIGDKGNSATRLGQLARTHIPIRYKAWPLVPERYKDALWTKYKAEYPEVKDSQRRIFMTKANDAWKKLKSRLRKENFVGNDIMKWKEKVPDLIKSEGWEKFYDNEDTEAQRLLRKRNKDIKDNCEQKTTNNTGRHGYARIAEIWEETHGRPPSRAELWLDSHKTKEGVYAPHDEKFANQIKLLLKVFQERGEKETLDSGPIYEVFGKDSRGRVRCVGSNISRKAMLASAFASEMLAEVNMKDNGCEEKVDNLTEEVERMKLAFTQFIEDFKNGKFVNVGHNFETSRTTENPTYENPLSVLPTRLTTQSQVGDDEINCNILSYKGEIVGRGRKLKIGAVTEVHAHKLKLREVKVVLDKIMMPKHSLWGGQQGCATTLEDVGIGGIMYWHDDFLPCIDG